MTEPKIVGQDPIIRKVCVLAERLAYTNHSIFIEGELGVGREQLARFLHVRGPRAAAPFSIFDFGAVARGAVSGALSTRCETAVGGTLLVKNFELLAPADADAVEATLAGAAGPTRVILAGQLPQTDVDRGRDLVARLGALPLYLSPLRARRADIPALAASLAERWSAENGGARAVVSDAAMLGLWRYDWPGNVRQLRDEVWTARTKSADGVIRPEHLSAAVRPRRLGPFAPPASVATESGRRRKRGVLTSVALV